MTREEAVIILDCERPYGNCGCGASDEEIEDALNNNKVIGLRITGSNSSENNVITNLQYHQNKQSWRRERDKSIFLHAGLCSIGLLFP